MIQHGLYTGFPKKKLLIIIINLMVVWEVQAQFQLRARPESQEVLSFANEKRTSYYLKADKQTKYTPSSPLLVNGLGGRENMSDQFWMGQVTTQSFNRGKFGTFYLWDLQGNLRQTQNFIDISGKKKRGWKLVLPRR